MADLRNKQRKDIERTMIRSMQARLDAARPKPVAPRCKCGLTPQEVSAMWVISGHDRWAPVKFYCPACLPEELKTEASSRPQKCSRRKVIL